MCKKCKELEIELAKLEADLKSEQELMDKSNKDSADETSLAIGFISEQIMYTCIRIVMCGENHAKSKS